MNAQKRLAQFLSQQRYSISVFLLILIITAMLTEVTSSPDGKMNIWGALIAGAFGGYSLRANKKILPDIAIGFTAAFIGYLLAIVIGPIGL